MRPMGEISRVLLEAAARQPGTVRDLAVRTQVGYAAARYTATRLVERGSMVRLGDDRPAVLGLPGQSFWEAPTAGADSDADIGATVLDGVTEAAFACL